MRIKETVLGNGLSRLDFEPMTFSEKNTPVGIVDMIMRDVIERKKRNEHHCGCENRMNRCCSRTPIFSEPSLSNRDFRFERPSFTSFREEREPDGIDVHVDRPLRSNFPSHFDWADAMAKYRTLERVAKDCNWECREPMRGTQDERFNSFEDECSFDFFDEDEEDDNFECGCDFFCEDDFNKRFNVSDYFCRRRF